MKPSALELVGIFDRIVVGGFYALLVFVPLIVLPWNFELFEFNKMVLTYIFAAIIAAAWVGKMVVARRWIWRRTFWDFFLLAFLVSQVAATVFSIDAHTSLFGYYSRFHGGLFSSLTYLVLFWALVSNLKKKQVVRGVRLLLGTCGVVAIYGVLEHWGIDKNIWVQDVQNRVFATLGQPNWLAAWLVALMPLAWAMGLENAKRKAQSAKLQLKAQNLQKLAFYFLSGLLFLALLYTKSRSGILGFVVADAVFWGGVVWTKKSKSWLKEAGGFHGLFVISILLAGTPWTPSLGELISGPKPMPQPQVASGTQLESGGTESGQIRKIVWQGAINVWKAYPVLGAGVETFAYSYYNFRPREHNDVSEWDFLYNKAHNEYLNLAANTGTVGLGAYLALIGGYLWWSVKKFKVQSSKCKVGDGIDKNVWLLGFWAGWVSILVTNFFGFSVVPVALLFFLYPGMGIMIQNSKFKIQNLRLEEGGLGWGQKAGLAVIGLGLGWAIWGLGKYWWADSLFAKGSKLNKQGAYTASWPILEKAVNLAPGEPNYRSELAEAEASLAVAMAKQEQATVAANLAQEAVVQSDRAVAISPRHVNLWKDRTVVFYKLAEIDSRYMVQALASLSQAVRLAPTDPKVHYNLGLIYYHLGEKEKAIETLEETMELKPDYRETYLALTTIWEKEGEKGKAGEIIDRWLKINLQDEEFRELKEKIQNFKP